MIDNSEQLKKIRKEKKLTIQAVSDGAGIASRTYQNYEYGKREISAEALYKLAEFYGVSTDYLLGRETDEKLNALYQKLTPDGKAIINKMISVLANSHKTENDRQTILATIGEMLITFCTEFNYQNSTKTSNPEKAEREIHLKVKDNKVVEEVIKDKKSVP